MKETLNKPKTSSINRHIKNYLRDEIDAQIQRAQYRIKPSLTKYTYEYDD